MPSVTAFNTRERYIYVRIFVKGRDGKFEDLLAILDTGAPATEFSDEALQYLGFIGAAGTGIGLKHGLQTQNYGKIMLPCVEICSHPIDNLEVYVSHFEKSWGVKALIGLDFFRRFRVTIDYKTSHIITDRFA